MAVVTQQGNSTLNPSEISYLEGFLDAGDRTGFYLAYYSMVGSDDTTLLSSSPVGKQEASLQSKIATFSGHVGAAAYISNRLHEEIFSSSTYPGIYYLSQQVAQSALNGNAGIRAALDNGGTGIISDEEFFETARSAWQAQGIEALFPGKLLNGFTSNDSTFTRTIDVITQLRDFLAQFVVDNGPTLTRSDLMAWIADDEPGKRAAALAGIYVSWNNIAGKQTASFANQLGYSTLVTADGNQEFVVDNNGHVVAAELVGTGGSGASPYEAFAASGIWAATVFQAAGLTFGGLSALGVVSVETLMAQIVNPLFTPYTDSLVWSDLTYPVGEAEIGATVPNTTPVTKFSAEGSNGAETLLGTDAPLGLGGEDSIDAGDGNDAIFGGGGSDVLSGGDGNDIIWGQEEEDILDGGAGDDVMRGGEDDDILRPGSGSDIVDGGDPLVDVANSGMDTADYSTVDSGVSIAVRLGSSNGVDAFSRLFSVEKVRNVNDVITYVGTDDLISIERIIGTDSDDTLSLAYGAWDSFDKIDYVDLGASYTAIAEGARRTDGIDAHDFDRAITVNLADPTNQWIFSDLKQLSLRNVESVIGTGFDDHITGISSNANGIGSYIDAGEGSDTIVGGDAKNALYGGAGNDVIYSSGSDDIIDGGAGNDVIHVSSTDATVQFGTGDGHDLVEFDNTGSSYALKLNGLNLSDVSIIAGGVDLYGYNHQDVGNVAFEWLGIKINSTGETIAFSNSDQKIGISGDADYSQRGVAYGAATIPLTSIQFADGSVLSQSALWNYIENWQTNENVEFDLMRTYPSWGNFRGISLSASTYLPHLNGTYFQAHSVPGPAPQTFNGTSGNDFLSDGYGDDTVQGFTGDDYIFASAGNDTVIWNTGDGNDIVYSGGSGYGTDILKLGAGILANDLVFSAQGTELTIAFSGISGSVTLADELGAIEGRGAHSISFDDGTVWSHSQLLSAAASAIAAAHQTVTGTSGDDYLYLPVTNFTASGGTGDDELNIFGDGSGTVIFSKGDGSDTYFSSGYRNDTLSLADILPSEVSVARSGDAAIITIAGTSDQITINSQFENSEDGYTTGFEKIAFSDNSIWTRADIETQLAGGSGDTPPILDSLLPDASVYRSQAIAIGLPAGTFADLGSSFTYTAAMADGSALPSWLSLDGDQLIGTVPDTGLGILDIRITATNANGSANDVFQLKLGVETGPEMTAAQWELVTQGNDRIVGDGAGNTFISGFGGDDYITTDNGYVNVDGGDGNDVIELFGDDGSATGGDGADSFLFDGYALLRTESYVTNWATIQDFEAGVDRIGILNGTAGVTNFTQLQPFLAQSGSDVTINLTGLPTITIANTNLATLTAQDFLFTKWDSFGGIGATPPVGVIPYPVTTNDVSIGNYTGTAGSDNDRITGDGAGNTSFHAYSGDDYITVDLGGVTAFGDRGNDIIEVDAVQSTIYGGPGYDYYLFNQGTLAAYDPWEDRWATLADYHDGVDKIVLKNGTGGVSDFAGVSALISQQGSDVHIALPDLPAIVLSNTTASSLDASDFLFVDDAARGMQFARTSPTTPNDGGEVADYSQVQASAAQLVEMSARYGTPLSASYFETMETDPAYVRGRGFEMVRPGEQWR